jgi:anti-anti-sigma factor
MKVRLETFGPTALVLPQGRLDFASADPFQLQLEQALAGAGTAPAALIIDCVDLDYVSSAGLRVLLRAARAAERAGVSFAVCALTPAVRDVFDLSGFSRIIAVHASRAMALQSPAGPA